MSTIKIVDYRKGEKFNYSCKDRKIMMKNMTINYTIDRINNTITTKVK